MQVYVHTCISIREVQENMHPVTLAYYNSIPSEMPLLYGPIRKVGASPIKTWLLVTLALKPRSATTRRCIDLYEMAARPVCLEVRGKSFSLGVQVQV